MTKEELLPFIIVDTNEFWENSVNPINSDSLLINSGVTDINEAAKLNNNQNGIAVKALIEKSYLISGEYIIAIMSAMVLTNRRLFTYYSDGIRSIALKNLVKYERQPDCLFIEYFESGIKQSFKIKTTFLNTEKVINSMAKYGNDNLTEPELILLSDTKIVLDAKYNINALAQTQTLSRQSVDDAAEYQRTGNRNRLILFLVIISLIVGCCYWLVTWDKGYRDSGQAYGSHSSDTDHYNKVTGKKQWKCSWCGGYGRQGISGASVEWCQTHPNGVGIFCLRCGGTGYVDEDSEKYYNQPLK